MDRAYYAESGAGGGMGVYRTGGSDQQSRHRWVDKINKHLLIRIEA